MEPDSEANRCNRRGSRTVPFPCRSVSLDSRPDRASPSRDSGSCGRGSGIDLFDTSIYLRVRKCDRLIECERVVDCQVQNPFSCRFPYWLALHILHKPNVYKAFCRCSSGAAGRPISRNSAAGPCPGTDRRRQPRRAVAPHRRHGEKTALQRPGSAGLLGARSPRRAGRSNSLVCSPSLGASLPTWAACSVSGLSPQTHPYRPLSSCGRRAEGSN
jgi:hypothetical protein